MNKLKKLAVGYARVSTNKQGKEGISLDAQREAIQTFAEEAGLTYVDTFADVATGAGAKSFQNRENLIKALNTASESAAVLVVWDWDRLSRYSGFAKQIKSVFPDLDQVICAKQGNTIRDASEKAVFAHGQIIRDRISKRTKKGMAARRSEGAVFGNPNINTQVQPLGAAAFSSLADDLVQHIAEVLRELEDPHNAPYARVAEVLNEKLIRTLQGKEWNASRAKIPVRKARALLRTEEERAMRSLPEFGMF